MDETVKTETVGGNTSQEQTTAKAVSFEDWAAQQPEDVKGLLDGHVAGLKSALNAERESRKAAEKNLRDLAKQAEEGSAAKKTLTEMADGLSEVTRRADFFEAAHAAGVTNLKLAYIAAQSDDLFDRAGRVDFNKLQAGYPELFGKSKPVVPAGNAGNGTNNTTPAKTSMNDYIRKAAGRS